MTPTLRVLFVSLFLCYTGISSAFSTSPLLAHRRSSSNAVFQGHQGLSAFQSSTPLHYRDLDIGEEPLASDTFSPQRQGSLQATTSDDPYNSGISMPLIRAIWFNQASIIVFATALVAAMSFFSSSFDLAGLHWNGSPNFSSFFNWNLTPLRILEGILATLPMVALGSLVEQSDMKDASHVNFSTTNMVISLFGRRRSDIDLTGTSTSLVMILSAAIALSTGISEEMVFRGYLPTALASISHSIPMALAGQAALFAFAHISPKSTPGENRIVGGMQFANGLWYGVVYLMTGGDLVPCIIAHMLYDMHVLCETWSVINHQMDYTQEAFQQRLDDREEKAIQRIQQRAGGALNTETLNYARRFFYAFDHEHKGSLCLSDVKRAVSYAFVKDHVSPEPEIVERAFTRVVQTRDASSPNTDERIGVSEFLRVLFALKGAQT